MAKAKNNKKKFMIPAIIAVLVVGGGVGLGLYYDYATNQKGTNDGESLTSEPTSFEECVQIGGAIAESYPRQCFIDDLSFVEDVQANTDQTSGEVGEEVEVGNVKLKVTKVHRNYQEGGEEEGKETVKIDFEFVNVGSEQAKYKLPDFWLTMEGDKSNPRSISLNLDRYSGLPPVYGVVEPSEKIYLYTTFRIEQDEKIDTLLYQPANWDNQAININLNIEVSSFEECSQAGGVVAESYPRQCFIDGQGFTEEITE